MFLEKLRSFILIRSSKDLTELPLFSIFSFDKVSGVKLLPNLNKKVGEKDRKIFCKYETKRKRE